MAVLYVVLPLAIVFAAGAIVTFIWATRSGQFDDMDSARFRVLYDDEPPPRMREWD